MTFHRSDNEGENVAKSKATNRERSIYALLCAGRAENQHKSLTTYINFA